MHTNQVELGRRNAGVFGPLMASATYVLTYLLCGMHCHKVGCLLLDAIQVDTCACRWPISAQRTDS